MTKYGWWSAREKSWGWQVITAGAVWALDMSRDLDRRGGNHGKRLGPSVPSPTKLLWLELPTGALVTYPTPPVKSGLEWKEAG